MSMHALPLIAFLLLPFLSAPSSPETANPAESNHESTGATPTSTSSVTADWPRFRGPTGMGVSLAEDLPLEWSESKNMVWKRELPGGGSSSPFVFGDHIYLTTYSGYLVPGDDSGSQDQLQRHLVCLSPDTGDVIWKRTVKAKLPEEDRIRDHGFAANTVATDAQGVVAFFGKSGVHAFDHDGNPLWTADVGSGTHGWGTSASPVLYKGMVFVNASVESSALFALDRQTGDEVWRVDQIREAWNSPLIVQNDRQEDEMVIAVKGKVLGLDPESGQQLWTCDTDITWYMVPTVVAEEGVVYCLGGRSGTAGLAVRTAGRGDVTDSHRVWTSRKGSNVTSPVVLNGHLYWMHEKLGIAYCADVETGELVYETRVSGAGQIYASALLAGDRIYYTNRSGRTFVVRAEPAFELLATNDLRDGTLFNASIGVSGNRLLIRSEQHLYCVGE